jgi:CheY-like chemotaxis protein
MQSARLLLRVINDILDYAKIESGTLQLCDAPYDFYRAMENMAELYLPLARRKGLTMSVVVMPHFDRRLIGDEIRISQVVGNLLSNAIAFTERGTITLSARRHLSAQRDEIEIAVRDTGAGMSEEYQSRLFSPFHQEDTSTTRRHGGTGLGLSIVKHLVERMGGRIIIHSRRGHGTCARIRIPARWNTQRMTWPDYASRTAALHLSNAALKPMLMAWCRKTGIHTLPADAPADIRILTDGGDGFWVATPTTRHGPLHALYPFLRTLEALWMTPRLLAAPEPAAQGAGGAAATATPPARARQTDEPRYLPSGTAADGSCAEGPAQSAPARGASDILLVEDNEINRDITLRQLALLGCSAYATEDGEAGYTAWLANRPRVMLVDCHMPRLDGYDLARRIRTQEMINGWPRTTLIGFSANATQSDARACLAAGMDDYVPKPTTRAKLLDALRRARFLPAADTCPPAL